MDESITVKRHYDEHAIDEWNRLEGFHFEYAITMAMFSKHLNKGRILDVGGGPGRYSIALAKDGNDVTLFDLSDGNVELAQAKAADAGVTIRALQGDARDLSKLGDERFDSILIMGPMYHLFDPKDRRRVLDEAKRHLNKNGKIFVSFISLSGGFNYYLSEDPAAMKDDPAKDYFDCAAKDQTWSGDAFTAATFVDPDEVRPFLRDAGWDVHTVFGQEGLTGPRLADLEKASKDVRAFYLDLSLKLCEKPKYHAYSSHLMAIVTPRSAWKRFVMAFRPRVRAFLSHKAFIHSMAVLGLLALAGWVIEDNKWLLWCAVLSFLGALCGSFIRQAIHSEQ